ncbi:DUF1361 domain-containing protein [Chitinophaga nivalis]|uniref:DUF1361 domain-containing protein n=1 Tax=Chitinophaga nivalis TaxID=2991709 RepID=A0ABT3IV50_9BACT|nr:DUF1361 domain-containing protein [Chitinophaga nivalis]MCW3462756.1 DUF1361 domain-containing protein [Chitinophaga nivalis]MCW3487554.1 DUF1361 domain-containing protein [Chitinophaga nivalis]
MKLKSRMRLLQRQVHRSRQEYTLYASVLFSLALLACRIAHTGSYLRVSLIWNLFLAYIPFAITGWMHRHPEQVSNRYTWYSCFVVWLLFVPNAPYILTDLFHLFDGGVPLWFDLFMIFSFAWNGMVLGYFSIRTMEHMWRVRHTRWPAWLFSFPVMFLCAMGVYIGRYLRYNSWDVVKDPLTLLGDMRDIVLHPWENRSAWAFTICMGIFLYLMYPFFAKKPQAR